jgi:hypothetical protein
MTIFSASKLNQTVPKVTRLSSNHIHSSMGLSISTTSRRQSTGRIRQRAICGDFRWQRYASFSCYIYWLLNKHGPCATEHVLHRSTPSMMIPFSTSFISIGHFLGTNMTRGMEIQRILVVHACPCLPKMEKHHSWLSILLGPFPALYIWHASCRHAGPFTSPSTPRRLLYERS